MLCSSPTAPHILYPPYRRDEERSEEPRDEGTNRVTSNRRVNGKRKSAAVSRPFTRSFATRNSLILYLSSPYAPQAGAERHAERYARRTEDRRAVGETSVERRVPLRYLSPSFTVLGSFLRLFRSPLHLTRTNLNK